MLKGQNKTKDLTEDIINKLEQNIKAVVMKKKQELIRTYEDEISKKEDKSEQLELFRQFTLNN